LLLSMTGFAEAHCRQDELAVAVEVRSFNSRYLKLSVRASDGYGALEPLAEAIVRKRVRRGAVQVNLRVDRTRSPDDYRINTDVLAGYHRQLTAWSSELQMGRELSFESLLPLPGVVEGASPGAVDAVADWPAVRDTLVAAMEDLARMRAEEGRAMAADLAVNCRTAEASLEQIERRAPLVVEAYRARLEDRLGKALAKIEAQLDPADLVREVGLFAERGDFSEEIVRLRSHLHQFESIMALPESSGRKLDFLTQEMFREVNTIGSKANDLEIARQVIEIKTAVERIREMLQNVE